MNDSVDSSKTAPPMLRRIEDATPFHAETNWIMAALAIAVAVGIVWWFGLPLEFDFQSPSFNPAVFVPVALIGYGLWQGVQSLRARAVGRRFGASVFEMQGECVGLGETLLGRVLTARDLNAPDGFQLRLCCVESTRQSEVAGGPPTRRRDVIRFEKRARIGAKATSVEGIAVEFVLPRDFTRSGGSRPSGQPLRWTLAIEAQVEGARYEALFGVPVTTLPLE